MDPLGTIADTATVGAVVGTAIALMQGRQDLLPEFVGWGTVSGGVLGICRALIEGLRL